MLVTLLSVVVACDDNAKPDDQKGSAKPPWLAALESKDFDYQGLVEDEYGDLDEVTVKIDFGSVVSTKAMRIPVTIGYQGPERSNSIRGLLLGADAVEHRMLAEGDTTVPSPGTKRKLVFTAPSDFDAAKLTLDIGITKIVLDRNGNSWEMAADEATKRYEALVDGTAKAEALCKSLAASECQRPKRKLVDSLVLFEAGDWQVTYCPEKNCYDACNRVREIAKGLGSSKLPWLHADNTFCIQGPYDRAKVNEAAIDHVKRLVPAPTLAEH